MTAAGVGLKAGGVPGDGRSPALGPPVIGQYRREPVQVREPDPRSPVVAARLAELIASEVPDLLTEHVGSSAVQGLAGKGIIDLLLPTPAERVRTVTIALLRLGFQRQTIPQAFPDSRPMLQGVVCHGERRYRVHLHIVPDASPEIGELRGFRDALRADAVLRRDYERLKREIVASGLTNPVDFTEAKRDFIVGTLWRLGLRDRRDAGEQKHGDPSRPRYRPSDQGDPGEVPDGGLGGSCLGLPPNGIRP